MLTLQSRSSMTAAPNAHHQSIPSRPCRSVSRRMVTVCYVRSANRLKYAGVGQRLVKEPLLVTVCSDASDAWRLDQVVQTIEAGGVGIIPTDTLPALVCDPESRSAVMKLYDIKDLSLKKQLSLLCRGFADIAHYTTGFPTALEPGEQDVFTRVRKILPGPYTLILQASKNLPSQCINVRKGTTRHRKTVGIRWSADPVCQHILDSLGKPLLATSVHVGEHLDEHTEVPDTGTMLDLYGNKGIDFIVDVGRRVATESTIIDMSTARPEVVREGAGDASLFM